MQILYCSVAFLVILSCLGCHNNRPFFKVSAEESVEEALNYYEEIKAMSNIEIKNEYENKEYLYINAKDKKNTLKYVLLMISPNSEFYNSHRAAYILDEMITRSGNGKGTYRNFAILMRDVITEINKKDLLYDETNKKLNNIISEKQERDFTYQEINKKIDSIMVEHEKKDNLNKKLNEEINIQKQAVERLQKKIEELKAIEKSINERKISKEPKT